MKSYHMQLWELTQEPGFNGTGWQGVKLSLEEIQGLLSEYRELQQLLKGNTLKQKQEILK